MYIRAYKYTVTKENEKVQKVSKRTLRKVFNLSSKQKIVNV